MASRTLFFSFFVFVLLLPEFEASITRGEEELDVVVVVLVSGAGAAELDGVHPRELRRDAVPAALLRVALDLRGLGRGEPRRARAPRLERHRRAPPRPLRRVAPSAAAEPRRLSGGAALRDCCESAATPPTSRAAPGRSSRVSTPARRRRRRVGAAWRVANAQTWLSAALTNEDTCADGFDAVAPGPGSAKGEVLARVRRVKQYTSNALALVNTLVAATHGP
ncbi:21 kDa protein [Ananas comosus]|uniref:21 kDa protein n=1 Tax=Ananas comosus TaxID=4615 RepID=A0A199V5J9_ANACO|nr:21 kDa protein [Ananas comosus]